MLHVGNQADHPLLVAVRDEDGRRAYVEAFGEVVGGEVAIFNAQGTARILIAADGSIEINSSADVNIRNNGDPVDSFVKRSEVFATRTSDGRHWPAKRAYYFRRRWPHDTGCTVGIRRDPNSRAGTNKWQDETLGLAMAATT